VTRPFKSQSPNNHSRQELPSALPSFAAGYSFVKIELRFDRDAFLAPVQE